MTDDIMFFGEYRHNIDAKKRLALPSKIRDCMSETMVMVGSLFSPCIALYPMDQWKIFWSKIDKLRETEKAVVRRAVFSRLCKTSCDSQGRILIPQNLCEYAHIDKNVVIVGADTYVEIWDADRWDQNRVGDESLSLSELLEKAGF